MWPCTNGKWSCIVGSSIPPFGGLSDGVGMETDGEVFKRTKEKSLIRLLSAFNPITGDLMKIHNVEYSVRRYAEDRAKLNSERSAMGLDEH